MSAGEPSVDYAEYRVLRARVRYFDAALAAGFVLVPKEPTEDMQDAGQRAYEKDGQDMHMSVYHCVGEAYRAMVAAAPPPKGSS